MHEIFLKTHFFKKISGNFPVSETQLMLCFSELLVHNDQTKSEFSLNFSLSCDFFFFFFENQVPWHSSYKSLTSLTLGFSSSSLDKTHASPISI